MLRQNKWRAGRHGLDADLIVDAQGNLEPLRTSIVELLDELVPTARELGCAKRAGEGAATSSSTVRAASGSAAAPDVIDEPTDLKPVVDLLVRELETDVVGQ